MGCLSINRSLKGWPYNGSSCERAWRGKHRSGGRQEGGDKGTAAPSAAASTASRTLVEGGQRQWRTHARLGEPVHILLNRSGRGRRTGSLKALKRDG